MRREAFIFLCSEVRSLGYQIRVESIECVYPSLPARACIGEICRMDLMRRIQASVDRFGSYELRQTLCRAERIRSLCAEQEGLLDLFDLDKW